MKHFTLALCAAFMVGVGLAPVHQVGAADEQFVNDADITVMNAATGALDAFHAELENEAADLASVKAKAVEVENKLDALAKHSFTTELSEGYTRAGDALKTASAELKTATVEYIAALESGDEAAFQAKGGAYDTALTRFGERHDTVNAEVDEANAAGVEQERTTGLSYLVTLIVTGLVAAASFAWAFLKKDKIEQLAAAQKSVALSSLWPLGGALITFVTYQMASAGGSYTIAWGAVIIGAVFFAKALFDYFKLKKQLAPKSV